MVENALLDHEAVAEAAVVAKADPRWGEVPVAFVRLRDGAEVSDVDLVG
ncbi:AMP-binding enzyme [Amycolatopsis sp. VC5-11]